MNSDACNSCLKSLTMILYDITIKSNTEHRYPYDKCQTKNTSCYSYKRQSGSEFFLKQNIQFIISDKIWTHTKDDKTRNG